MKRGKLTLVAVVLSGSLLFSSCGGSFGLFNRLSSWNQSVGNKFVNELVFLAFNIVPVYGVAYLADALVINSIEFWSGSNPMANVGDVKKVKGENGNYMVKTLENGYSITKEGLKPKLYSGNIANHPDANNSMTDWFKVISYLTPNNVESNSKCKISKSV